MNHAVKNRIHPGRLEEKGSRMPEIANPRIRIRMAHVSTVKEGWRLGESTVEWEGEVDDPTWEPAMREKSQKVFIMGLEESIRRNADEKRVNS